MRSNRKQRPASILPAERFMQRTRIHPDPVAVDKAARALIEAKSPVIIMGDEVWKSGAQAELLSFAEYLSVPVVKPGDSSFDCSYQPFPTKHPLHLGVWDKFAAEAGQGTDLIFFVGAPDAGGKDIPKSAEVPMRAKFMRLGMDTYDQGRNYPTDIAMFADIKAGLHDIRAAIDSLLTKERRGAIAGSRGGTVCIAPPRRCGSARKKRLRPTSESRRSIHTELCKVMAETLDKNAIMVSENLTGKFDSFDFGFRENEMMYLGNSGASLGWGVGAATGAKLAAPDRQVVCSIGDGSVMYSASGFWTQARYHIPVLTVVWNNRNYQTVRHAYHAYGGRMASSGKYAGMYMGDPDIDFVKLAGSQKVAGERVTSGSESAGGARARHQSD